MPTWAAMVLASLASLGLLYVTFAIRYRMRWGQWYRRK